ncbi:phosphogluconate dehydrogenase (NAD(+)-dependent, decarboxylating) [Methanoculleus taiwanensis]|nr:decarboxylating 6-phosphogluconate dehydrogenase [Methanoculleus taiwanensis]
MFIIPPTGIGPSVIGMAEGQMQLGIVGLGKMGGNLAVQAAEKGIDVVGTAHHKKPELEEQGVRFAGSYPEFAAHLRPPRVIYLSVPAGPPVDEVLAEMVPHLDRGDVVMDGGNSFYLDSMAREKECAEKGIHFLDCGTSGGFTGARHGACFMVGGSAEGFRIAEPVLRRLAVDEGLVHTGKAGSGHFVKLVHNGIEFGMLQAIGEGVSLMRGCGQFDLDLRAIFHNWAHGSVIRSWLIELMEQGLKERNLESIESYVEDTGEVNWLLESAIQWEVPIPVTAIAIMELFKSREKDSDTYRSIALMRHGFGGHPFGKDEHIAEERKISRIARI